MRLNIKFVFVLKFGVYFLPIFLLALSFKYIRSTEYIALSRDASYYYLLNSIQLASGNFAYYWAHPGASLQLFGGLLIRLKYFFIGSSDLPIAQHLLTFHKEYMHFLGCSLIVVNFLALLLLTRTLVKQEMKFIPIFLVQTIFFIQPNWFMNFNGLFQPESIYIALGAVFATLLCIENKKSWINPMFAGFSIATKLNFAQFLIINFLNSSKKKIALSFLLSIIIFALLCFVFFPEWNRAFPHMLGLALAKNQYAEGGVGIISYIELKKSLIQHFENDPLILLIIPGVILFSLFGLFFKSSKLKSNFYISVFAFFLALMFFLKKPTHAYYFISVLATLPAVLATFFIMAKGRIHIWIGTFYFLLVLVLRYDLYVSVIPSFLAEEKSVSNTYSQIEKIVKENSECAFLVSGPIPLGVDALEMGSAWAGKELHPELAYLFPKFAWLNSNGWVRGFEFKKKPLSVWAESMKVKCFLFFSTLYGSESLDSSLAEKKLMYEDNLASVYSLKIRQ
ncbi:MAG: hypothetical protein M9962_13875 [Oligoflexia bacterium]|nr:hypothetical protein [Oligoflexia bacterium]